VSCGVGHRRGSDLAWLWSWHRPAATALIRLLAWEPPYAMGVALKRQKKKKKKKRSKDSKQDLKEKKLRFRVGEVLNVSGLELSLVTTEAGELTGRGLRWSRNAGISLCHNSPIQI